MKAKFLFAALFMLLWVPFVTAQNYLFIFMDYSGSFEANRELTEDSRNMLKRYILENVTSNQDVVIVSYMHSNSASVANQKRYVFNFLEPDYSRLSEREAKLRKAMTQSLLYRYKQSFCERILSELHIPSKKQYTSHLLESLVQVQRHTSKAASLQLVYLSDMVEWSPYRKLGYVQSKEQAESFAVADSKKLRKNFGLGDTIFTDPKIACYMKASPLNGNKTLQYVLDYWGVVFREFFENPTIEFLTL